MSQEQQADKQLPFKPKFFKRASYEHNVFDTGVETVTNRTTVKRKFRNTENIHRKSALSSFGLVV